MESNTIRTAFRVSCHHCGLYVLWVSRRNPPDHSLLVAWQTSLAKTALLEQMGRKPAAAMTPRCRRYLPLEERAAVQ